MAVAKTTNLNCRVTATLKLYSIEWGIAIVAVILVAILFMLLCIIIVVFAFANIWSRRRSITHTSISKPNATSISKPKAQYYRQKNKYWAFGKVNEDMRWDKQKKDCERWIVPTLTISFFCAYDMSNSSIAVCATALRSVVTQISASGALYGQYIIYPPRPTIAIYHVTLIPLIYLMIIFRFHGRGVLSARCRCSMFVQLFVVHYSSCITKSDHVTHGWCTEVVTRQPY